MQSPRIKRIRCMKYQSNLSAGDPIQSFNFLERLKYIKTCEVNDNDRHGNAASHYRCCSCGADNHLGAFGLQFFCQMSGIGNPNFLINREFMRIAVNQTINFPGAYNPYSGHQNPPKKS